MIATTEIARSRNLLGWMRMASAVARLADPDRARQMLGALRKVEVELEVRQLRGHGTAAQIAAISDLRAELQAKLNEHLMASGAPPLAWSVDGIDLLRDTESLIKGALEMGDAALCLFSIAHGVCAAVAWKERDGSGVRRRFHQIGPLRANSSHSAAGNRTCVERPARHPPCRVAVRATWRDPQTAADS